MEISELLENPQFSKLIADWQRLVPDSNNRESFQDKLNRLSPDPPFLVAALLYYLFPEPEKLPSYCAF